MFGKDTHEKPTKTQADAAYNKTGAQACCRTSRTEVNYTSGEECKVVAAAQSNAVLVLKTKSTRCHED